ncbi:TPA: T9SS type A sorting domain-containing protein [bacterium]|nr:T9SS type A sorting domain-containing protein [bacterium]
MKRNQKTRRANTLFTLAALLVVLMSNVFMARSQTNELPDTVWTKFTYPYAINAVKFTPDGRYLASGGDDGVPRLWDAETGELVREFQGNDCKIWSLDIKNTGDMLAIVNDSSEIFIWNLDNGEIIKIIDYFKEFGGRSNGRCVTFSHNGRYLASILSHNGKKSTEHDLVLFDVNTWDKITSINDIAVPFNVDFSPNDQLLAASNLVFGEKRIAIGIYQVPKLQFLGKLDEYENSSRSAKFSTEGNLIAGAFSSEPNKIWNTSDWSLKSEIGNGTDSRAIEFSPDSKYVVFQKGYFGNRHVQIWENNILNYEYPKSSLVSSISISPDMRYIAVSNASGIIVYNAKWNPTSVAEGSIQILEPEIFPNPNDGKAIIRFNLIKNADVSVDIYDINSRLISNLYKGELNQGIQSFEWLAKVPNGIYFAKISSGKSVSSIKIIVER